MTSDEFDTWRVVNSQFVGADSKSGIRFVLNNVPEAQNSCKVRQNKCRNGLHKRPMAGVTLRDLDPGTTVYGFSISLNTINAACNAKTHSRKQWSSPRYDRSQNPQISTDHDVMYDVITTWPDLTRPWHFQGRCKKDGHKGVPNFSQIGYCVLALSSNNLGGCITPPPAVPARVNRSICDHSSKIYITWFGWTTVNEQLLIT